MKKITLSLLLTTLAFSFLTRPMNEDVFELVRNEKFDELKQLYAENPNIFNQFDAYGYSPLHIAVNEKKSNDMVTYLAHHSSAGILLENDLKNNMSPLATATFRAPNEISFIPLFAKKIVENHLNIDKPTNDGVSRSKVTALYLETAGKCDFQSVHELLKAGASTSIGIAQNKTPIKNAEDQDHEKCIALLKDYDSIHQVILKLTSALRIFTKPIDASEHINKKN